MALWVILGAIYVGLGIVLFVRLRQRWGPFGWYGVLVPFWVVIWPAFAFVLALELLEQP